MKAAPVRFHAPACVDEARHALVELGDDAKVLAGGPSLVPLLALRLARPSDLIDVSRLTELAAVESDGATVTIGATVRPRVAERDPVLATGCPLLAEALPSVPAARILELIGVLDLDEPGQSSRSSELVTRWRWPPTRRVGRPARRGRARR